MKRRSLFAMMPAASVLLALRSHGAPILESAVTPAGFSIAVQCWSFRAFTLFEAITMAAAVGAGGVEIFPNQKIGGPHGDVKMSPEISDDVAESLRNHLAEHKISAVNYGVTDIPKDEGKARKVFALARKFGMYGITTESLEAIDVIEKLAAEHDVKVCFHNHPKPTKLWNPEKIWNAVKDRHENLGFCADVGHWASSGMDPLVVIQKIAPRVRSFHMKDRESIKQWTHDRPFGTGIIDIPGILDEVRKHGFAGNVSIEYEHNWENSLVEIARCAGFLRGYSAVRR